MLNADDDKKSDDDDYIVTSFSYGICHQYFL